MSRPTLLYFVSEDWYFCAHWLHFAKAARQAGYRVVVLTRVREKREEILDAGLELIPIELSRHGLNPLRDLGLIRRLAAIYREVSPDLVHQVAMKPIIYGTLAARLAGVRGVINLAAGLGVIFSKEGPVSRLLRPFIRFALRRSLAMLPGRFVFQNPDDARRIFSDADTNEKVRVIHGVGVDTQMFVPSPLPEGAPVVVLPARLIWDKGIREFVDAAAILRERAIAARLALVGEPDRDNPNSVPQEQLQAWHEQRLVEWWGQRSDMDAVYAAASLCCLPTKYGEGLPTVLLEAGACGRALIATDAPGCREIVQPEQNGLLVPVGDTTALADALARLLTDPELLSAMGRRSREIVEQGFTRQLVITKTLDLYAELVPPNIPEQP